MKPTTTNILETTGKCFSEGRLSLLAGIAGLIEIFDRELWREGGYSNFGEYVEQVCQLHPSAASRYMKAYRHYSLEGGFSIAKLAPVDVEKLYLAIGTSGNAEEQFERASSLTRKELREELSVKENGDEHDCTFAEFCTTCWKRK